VVASLSLQMPVLLSIFVKRLDQFRRKLGHEITLQRDKEDMVIGISLVPVACGVVCWIPSAVDWGGVDSE
jgi:hypothetical protein